MQIEIEGRHKNNLLHREEITFEILGVKTTPSRIEIRKALAGQLGVGEELVMIDEIDHEFGSTRVVGFAKKYDSVEELKKIESTHMRKRHGDVDAKPEAKPASEAKGE